MNSSLLILLVVLVVFTAGMYYIFITRREEDISNQGRAAIIFIAAFLIPIVLIALWQQNNAKNDLAGNGISILDRLGPSVGVRMPLIADTDVWVFEYTGDEAALMDYYRDPVNRPDWEVVKDSGEFLHLEKDSLRMMITAGDETAIFQIFRPDKQP